jgi:hypothetical protein
LGCLFMRCEHKQRHTKLETSVIVNVANRKLHPFTSVCFLVSLILSN